MNLLPYTEAHEDFRRRLRAFLEAEVAPRIDRWETDTHIVPREIWRRMGGQGFLCMSVPPAYGGPGLDFLYSVIVIEEISRTNHNGLAAPLHSDIVVPYIASYGSEAQKRKYLPGCVSGEMITAVAMTEPGAGSDLASMATTAVQDGDTVVLDGAKTFITNGINADLVVVAARDPAVENPHQAISLYLVEAGTPGFSRGRHLEKMGYHSQDTAELFFSGCRIPAANRLGQAGAGFLMLMEKLQQERLVVAVMGQAQAEFILDWATRHLKRKLIDQRPRARSQDVQFALVEMATEVRLGRTFLDTLIVDHMADKNVVVETSMAKYWISEMAHRTAARCLELCGPEAGLERCPAVRTFRDTRVMSIFAGTNEIMKQIAAKFMGL
ncbi:MAG TPA: acyl-CoA dehydrogenase [Desulfobacteraceae bacterium]|nr:acyl-CoA dehydrogenase family protein [Deltaproteobacteria bacterium]MBW2356313.1 acyl-CoA dehydrogenase family protein [Deltaproteobacteria bacterium]HDI59231.1 acyl-CoA dehydrogenase [Desulfobacteraceae bacterium]